MPDSGWFAFSSCQYPAGIFDRVLARSSIERLEQRLAKSKDTNPCAAVLLLGDQIYADATYGILDPNSSLAGYQTFHEEWIKAIQSDRWPVLRNMWTNNLVLLSPDDHEIRENWEPNQRASEQALLEAALRAYDTNFSLTVNPSRSPDGGYWGPQEIGKHLQVFMLDTRTTRNFRPWGPGTGDNQAHIVNKAQQIALAKWLSQRRVDDGDVVTPKFISSQVGVLPRHAGRYKEDQKVQQTLVKSSSRIDSWDGYPESLCWLLGYIAKEQIHGVVVLCGDAHLAGRAQVHLDLNGQCTDVLILHTPALYAPFPFANAQPHHYRRQDSFDFKVSTGTVRCRVTSQLQDLGNGFVRVEVTKTDTNGWQVRPVFDSEMPPPESMCAPWPCAPGQTPAPPLNPSHTD